MGGHHSLHLRDLCFKGCDLKVFLSLLHLIQEDIKPTLEACRVSVLLADVQSQLAGHKRLFEEDGPRHVVGVLRDLAGSDPLAIEVGLFFAHGVDVGELELVDDPVPARVVSSFHEDDSSHVVWSLPVAGDPEVASIPALLSVESCARGESRVPPVATPSVRLVVSGVQILVSHHDITVWNEWTFLGFWIGALESNRSSENGLVQLIGIHELSRVVGLRLQVGEVLVDELRNLGRLSNQIDLLDRDRIDQLELTAVVDAKAYMAFLRDDAWIVGALGVG